MGRDCRVYVGNLPPDVRSRDLEDIFTKYGKVLFVDIKGHPARGPPFAFVEFDDPRDAEDAVKARDGYNFDGYRIRVEFTRGSGPRGPGGRPSYDSGGGSRSSRRTPPRRRNAYRLVVTGLPFSGSWQDLKDHFREAGEVAFADVFRDGTGVVEFGRYDDMKYALKKLDDTKFKSHEGETAYIRVKEEADDRRSRSRSPTPVRATRGSPRYSRSRTRSRSPRSRSRSRSRSPSY